MSQFNYVNDLTNALGMDSELTKGPAPRWQRKLDSSTQSVNNSINTSKLSISYNGYAAAAASSSASNKTPNKSGSSQSQQQGKKTPNSKSPGRQKTPSKDGAKTPTGGGGDRFIPSRANSNFELGHYMIKQEMQKDQNQENVNCNNESNIQQSSSQSSTSSGGGGSSQQTEQQRAMGENLNSNTGDLKQKRILSYQIKAPAAPESHQNPLKIVYSSKTPMSTKSCSRYISQTPERILDAPDIINDYYLNLMDWSKTNVLTIALGSSIYLWNAGNGKTEQLFEYPEGEHACALSWIENGHILAVGNNSGLVELWDCAVKKRLRVMDGHAARVGVLAWNNHVCTSGSLDHAIIHHDVRTREHKVATLLGHTQEVCGLKWSPDNKFLASGGNDNLVNVWAMEGGSPAAASPQPLHSFNQHQAAVRALAWCPWQPHVLASGGGTADRCIKFWNTNNGSLIESVDTKSQVCSLLFSKNYKELISAHGYANNQLTIWKYPAMTKQVELVGHTSRILQMAMSPDGSSVISASADETLRLWNCFQLDPAVLKKKKAAAAKTESAFQKTSIR